jgi:beta-N-acetylhexosaminidase
MKALEGPPDRRAEAALTAGCDIALHCNGVLGEMEMVAAVCPPLIPAARARLSRAEAMRSSPGTFDVEAALERMDAMLGAHAR